MYLNFGLESDELEKRMGGGLYQGQIITVMGGVGDGKTLFSIRLAYGLVKNGNTVAYVSSQFPIREFISESETLGYPLFDSIMNDRVTYLTSVFVLMRARKPTIEEILLNRKIGEKNVVILDSLQEGMFKDFEPVQFYSSLRKFSEGRIVMVTLNPSDFDEQTLLKIHQLSTTVISLNSKDMLGERKHIIDLIKFPMARHSFQQTIPYRIEPGRGLIVEISSVS